MKDEDLRTQSEMDQALSENLDEMDDWFEELVELAEGEGPITDDQFAELARLACGTCTIVIGLRDYLRDQLDDGYEGENA